MRFLFLFALSALFAGCVTQPRLKGSGAVQLRYLSSKLVPAGLRFGGTTVGGLSGIDYDAREDLYYLLSDDRSDIDPSRFYTARISLDGHRIDSVQFTGVAFLLNGRGEQFAPFSKDPEGSTDPESIRFDARRGRLLWTSEGERLQRRDTVVLHAPSVNRMDRGGRLLDTFTVPPQFFPSLQQKGPRRNGVWEGSSFARDYRYFYVSTEEPLYDDGPRAGLNDSAGLVRFIKFDAAAGRPLAQYVYRIEPVAKAPDPPGSFEVNGVTEILWVREEQFLVLERSFSNGQSDCIVRLYLADLEGATDVSGLASLKGTDFRPVAKRLLLDFSSLPVRIDNVEGMTWGPKLGNGKQSLILVTDDNFARSNETRLFLFEAETTGKPYF